MPLTASSTAVGSHGGGGSNLSPIVYSQIVHRVPPRTFASDYSLGGGGGNIQPTESFCGGQQQQQSLRPPGSGGDGTIPSSSTTMTTVTSSSAYSTEAEINHPGSSLSLDVAPSEYLERSLVSSFRNGAKHEHELI